MIKIALAGAGGRMGGAIIRQIVAADDLQLVLALDRGENIGKDAGELAGLEPLGVALSVAEQAIDAPDMDIMIDFTRPDATCAHLDICAAARIPILVGTTGLGAEHNQAIAAAADTIAVMYAPNTSVGVNVCAALVESASRVLGAGFDIEVVEAHHKHKVDAPSGTALLLGEAAANGRDVAADTVFARHGHNGERTPGSIGFASIRGGDIAGEHSVLFIGENERIEITHRATDRKIFASGAIRAARWLVGQSKGLYSIQDMLDVD